MILAIDYDLTIVDASGNLLEGAKENINYLHDDGHQIIIWTCREGASLDEAKKNLEDNGIWFDQINENCILVKRDPRKIIADIYIDDKGINGIPSWDEIYSMLSNQKGKTKNIRTMETAKYTFGEVRAFTADVEKTRTVEFVISSNTKDRHGTVLPVDKWNLERFNSNGIVGYQHNVYGGDLCNAPDPDDVIGVGKAWRENDLIIGSVKFEDAANNPKAEKIFRKVLAGILKATSVGFNPTAPGAWGIGEEAECGANPTYYYGGQELLEFSIVNIPSNPDALKRSMRDQAANAISYIYRQFGGEVRFSDIEKMTVADVIAQLENRSSGHTELVSGSEEKSLSVKVEIEIEIDPETLPDPVEGTSDQVIDQMNEQRESDQDMILITRSKLALHG